MQPVQQVQSDGRQITIIHFCYIQDNKEHIACMPGMKEFHLTQFHPQYMRSNDPRAVTCPGCKSTKVYIGANK